MTDCVRITATEAQAWLKNHVCVPLKGPFTENRTDDTLSINRIKQMRRQLTPSADRMSTSQKNLV